MITMSCFFLIAGLLIMWLNRVRRQLNTMLWLSSVISVATPVHVYHDNSLKAIQLFALLVMNLNAYSMTGYSVIKQNIFILTNYNGV